MNDNRNGAFSLRGMNGNTNGCGVVIDTYQVFDSCRDRDCFENVKVFLDSMGQSIIEHTTQIRAKCAEICSSAISVEPVQLSCGFYRVIVRFFVKIEFEACLCPGKIQSFCGLAVVEKSVVLYGGEGAVHIFRSSPTSDGFCTVPACGEMGDNMPIAVVETVDPVLLGTKVVEPTSDCCCHCFCTCGDIPHAVSGMFGELCDNGNRYLAVSLGFFSVIRIERPEQYLINAVECSVPDKECNCTDSSSPCDAFKHMAFPIDQFAPGRVATAQHFGCDSHLGDCGCKKG